MTTARLWPATVIATILAASAATAVGLPNPARAILVFWFFLVCPGMAIVPLMGVRNRATELTLVIAGSLAIDTLVAETMLLAKVWSPPAGLATLAAVSVCGAAAQLRRPSLQPAAEESVFFRPEPARIAEPEPEPAIHRGWHVDALRRLIALTSAEDPDGEVERSATLVALSPYADEHGHLPLVFDAMIRDVFVPR